MTRLGADVRIESWPGAVFAEHADRAMAIYAIAMNYPASTGIQRAVTARRHANNHGFACQAAMTSTGQLVGFAYGYTSVPGQWWHDLVRRAVGPLTALDWLQHAFELSEIHVLPGHQGQGIGRTMLHQLAAGLPHETLLLSTPDADTRAFRLYRDLGFVDLARNYLFPGDGRPFAVLGRRLPFDV